MTKEAKLLFLTTPFCNVCKTAKPIAEIVAMSLSLQLIIQNVHEVPSIAQNMKIDKLPALVLLRNDVPIVGNTSLYNVSQVYDFFEKALKNIEKT